VGPGTGEQQEFDDSSSGGGPAEVLSRPDGDLLRVGPPPEWEPFEATERIKQITHDFPEHWAAREQMAKEKPPKLCEWCEEHGKTLRTNSGEERKSAVLEVDADPDYEDR
jgi:hypothetical protein